VKAKAQNAAKKVQEAVDEKACEVKSKVDAAVAKE